MPALHANRANRANRKPRPGTVTFSNTVRGVQQNCYQDYRDALDRAQASADEADQLLHHCRQTMEDAIDALSTPSESAASDDGAQEDDISPVSGYWAQGLGGSDQLQARGKFWSQKVQLQALTRNVQAFKEYRSQLLCVVAETAHLQVRSSSPETTAYHPVFVCLCSLLMVHLPGFKDRGAHAGPRVAAGKRGARAEGEGCGCRADRGHRAQRQAASLPHVCDCILAFA
jgi:hypothetical protein